MAAPKGNEYWKLAVDIGKPKAYTPETLLEKANAYFEWACNNPWYKNEAVKSGDNVGDIIPIPTARPLTTQGFCVYAGITYQTFLNYEAQQEYLEVIRHIRNITYTQKLEGAAVGAFNANIIARDLGLADKSEQKTEVSGSLSFGGIQVVNPNDQTKDIQTRSDSEAVWMPQIALWLHH